MYSAQQHCLTMRWLYTQSSPDLVSQHATGYADQPAYSRAVRPAKPEAISDACLLCAAV